MNQLDEDYKGLLAGCLYNSNEKSDRTGTGTLSVFGRQIKHRMADGFPLLTTKKMAIKTMMTELKWFLKGDTNIRYLVENGCNIWNGDAYKNYCKIAGDVEEPDYTIHIDDPNHNSTRLMTQEEFINKIKTNDEFAREWGELGPIYGTQWREWNYTDIDQIANLINDLKTNPDSRRLMVSAWNVGELNQMVLPPCHYGFQVYTRDLGLDERINLYNGDEFKGSSDYFHEHMDAYGIPRKGISLMWNQRSVDTFLGLPFNIASYATLLLIISEEVNMMPDYLIGNLGDVHLYKNHTEQAKELISRTPYKLPTLKLSNVDILNGEFDWELLNYESHPQIKAPLSN